MQCKHQICVILSLIQLHSYHAVLFCIYILSCFCLPLQVTNPEPSDNLTYVPMQVRAFFCLANTAIWLYCTCGCLTQYFKCNWFHCVSEEYKTPWSRQHRLRGHAWSAETGRIPQRYEPQLSSDHRLSPFLVESVSSCFNCSRTHCWIKYS